MVYNTDIKGIKFIKRGKVRDIYELDSNLLIVATDRISAFDRVLKTPIPDKGKILTAISTYFFEQTSSIMENHFITSSFEEFPRVLLAYENVLRDRSMLVKKAKPIPFEFIVRGYMAGSLYRDYRDGKVDYLPSGLREFDKLPELLFTPTTKAEKGHDMPSSFEEIANAVGYENASFIKKKCFEIYTKGSDIVAEKGIVILDTKFEFGWIGDSIILIDEVLTPDSSRYRITDKNGNSIKLDKQILRDYLESKRKKHGAMPNSIPKSVVMELTSSYNRLKSLILESQ